MRIIRKRSKRASEQEKISDESKRYNKNFWFDQNRWKNHIRKIVVITAFLALLGVLFLYNDDLDIKSKKYRLVPDPENPLPPSSAILHSFRHAAVSSDSQVCSDIARYLSLICRICSFVSVSFYIEIIWRSLKFDEIRMRCAY